MESKRLNLFIVDDNELMVAALKVYLEERFENSLNVSTFYTGDSCLARISEDTDIVILDYILDDNNDGLEVLKAIKKINPITEVIMLSSNQDIALAIESFQMGAKDYVVKGHGSWQKLTKLIEKIIKAPIRILVKEFGVSTYMATFLLTFVTMCVVVLCALQLMK